MAMWEYSHNGWRPMPPDVQAEIEDGFARYQQNQSPGGLRVNICGFCYEVDFARLVQRNTRSGKERQLRRRPLQNDVQVETRSCAVQTDSTAAASSSWAEQVQQAQLDVGEEQCATTKKESETNENEDRSKQGGLGVAQHDQLAVELKGYEDQEQTAQGDFNEMDGKLGSTEAEPEGMEPASSGLHGAFSSALLSIAPSGHRPEVASHEQPETEGDEIEAPGEEAEVTAGQFQDQENVPADREIAFAEQKVCLNLRKEQKKRYKRNKNILEGQRRKLKKLRMEEERLQAKAESLRATFSKQLECQQKEFAEQQARYDLLEKQNMMKQVELQDKELQFARKEEEQKKRHDLQDTQNMIRQAELEEKELQLGRKEEEQQKWHDLQDTLLRDKELQLVRKEEEQQKRHDLQEKHGMVKQAELREMEVQLRRKDGEQQKRLDLQEKQNMTKQTELQDKEVQLGRRNEELDEMLGNIRLQEGDLAARANLLALEKQEVDDTKDSVDQALDVIEFQMVELDGIIRRCDGPKHSDDACEFQTERLQALVDRNAERARDLLKEGKLPRLERGCVRTETEFVKQQKYWVRRRRAELDAKEAKLLDRENKLGDREAILDTAKKELAVVEQQKKKLGEFLGCFKPKPLTLRERFTGRADRFKCSDVAIKLSVQSVLNFGAEQAALDVEKNRLQKMDEELKHLRTVAEEYGVKQVALRTMERELHAGLSKLRADELQLKSDRESFAKERYFNDQKRAALGHQIAKLLKCMCRFQNRRSLWDMTFGERAESVNAKIEGVKKMICEQSINAQVAKVCALAKARPRMPGVRTAVFAHVPDDTLRRLAEELLHSTSHRSNTGCKCIMSCRVTRIERVENITLLGNYERKRDSILENREKRGIQHEPLAPAVFEGLRDFRALVRLEEDLNEELLMHGTRSPQAIADEGFDERCANHGLYGEGTYFADLSCKSHQYTGPAGNNEHCIVLARVILGDVHYTDSRTSGRRPPARKGGGFYDSVVANSHQANGGQQIHREYVVFDGKQACPELLIFYR